MKEKEPTCTHDIFTPSRERPLNGASKDGMPPVIAIKDSTREPRAGSKRAAIVLPACYLGAIVAFITIGLSPIAFGLCLGLVFLLAAVVPFLMPLLAWGLELARAWDATEPVLVFFVICNCLLLYRFGTHLDQ